MMNEKDKIQEEQLRLDTEAGTEMKEVEKQDQHTEQEKETEDKSVARKLKKHSHQHEIKQLQEKLDELNDKYLRLYSEFDNFRKRTLREKIELTKTAGATIITDLLPVLDDFERAVRLSEQTNSIDAIREGEQLILTKLKTILEQKGLSEIKSVGQPFNTDLHDAVTNIPSPSEDMKGKIVDEIEKGYQLNGKVIRYAKVVIGQ